MHDRSGVDAHHGRKAGPSTLIDAPRDDVQDGGARDEQEPEGGQREQAGYVRGRHRQEGSEAPWAVRIVFLSRTAARSDTPGMPPPRLRRLGRLGRLAAASALALLAAPAAS